VADSYHNKVKRLDPARAVPSPAGSEAGSPAWRTGPGHRPPSASRPGSAPAPMASTSRIQQPPNRGRGLDDRDGSDPDRRL